MVAGLVLAVVLIGGLLVFASVARVPALVVDVPFSQLPRTVL